MKLGHKMLASGALLLAIALADSASATNYSISFGTSLNGRITTAPSTGSNQTITSISGTFLGQAITGIIADPYSPAVGYYYNSVGTPQPSDTYPPVLSGAQYYYRYDNLLLPGNTFDGPGILFSTAADIVNLYSSGNTFELDYSPKGTNPDPTSLFGTLSITPLAAVPEPVTWELAILGFGLVGFAMRRRNITPQITYAA